MLITPRWGARKTWLRPMGFFVWILYLTGRKINKMDEVDLLVTCRLLFPSAFFFPGARRARFWCVFFFFWGGGCMHLKVPGLRRNFRRNRSPPSAQCLAWYTRQSWFAEGDVVPAKVLQVNGIGENQSQNMGGEAGG